MTSPIIAAAIVSSIFAINTSTNPFTTADIKDTTALNPIQTTTRPSATITAQTLYADFLSGQESADAKYIGQPVNIRGIIAEVSPATSSSKWVRLETNTGSALVQCQLAKDLTFNDAISTMIGKTVIISGICKGFSGNYVIIENISSNDIPIILSGTSGK